MKWFGASVKDRRKNTARGSKNPSKPVAWNLLKSPQDRLKLLELIRIPKDPQRIPEESLEDHQKPLELELELVEIPHRII